MRVDLEAGLYRLLRFNPCVSRHELRLRMRGSRAFWVLFAYAGIAAGIFLITMWVTAWQARTFSRPGLSQPNLGRIVLASLSYTQLVLLLLILPAYSAGAITMEREKRTLDMLRATLLTPSDVVSGKLLVVLALGVMLLLTSLPITSWSLLLGGVSPEEILYIYTYLLVIGAFAAALGMLFSSLLGRSVGAVVASYGMLLALILLPLIAFAIVMSIVQSAGSRVAFGDVWGAIGLTVVGLACAWLVFLALRWAWRRAFGARFPLTGQLLPACVVLPLLAFLLWPGGPALKAAGSVPVGWIFQLQPFLALGSLLEGGSMAGLFLGMGTPGRPGTAVPNLQLLIWAVCTTFTLLATLLCWALSIRVYRVRR